MILDCNIFSESFELMRKEQQKALQEKQNNPDKHKDGHVSDVNAWLEDTKDRKRISNRSNELEESTTQTVSNNDSWKSSSQILGSRPLVPPGFKSTTLEKNSSARALNNSHSTEVYSGHYLLTFYVLELNAKLLSSISTTNLEATHDKVLPTLPPRNAIVM